MGCAVVVFRVFWCGLDVELVGPLWMWRTWAQIWVRRRGAASGLRAVGCAHPGRGGR